MRIFGIGPAIAALAFAGVAAAAEPPVPVDVLGDPHDMDAPFVIAQGPGVPPPGGPGLAPEEPIFMMRGGGPGPSGPMVVMRGPGLGAWWRDSQVTKTLELSEAQIARIEQTYMAHRLRLVDLRADLEKQELRLQPLLDVEQPEETKVAAQLDLITVARGKLEKENALMLLAVRRVLSVEQWKKLQTLQHERARTFQGGPPRLPGEPGGPMPPRPPR